ncbi:MAG: type transport system permease protein, partial [Frankiaceae bacterium]|nr:type transport system permease protein [Frankiaceae bacterium]
GEYVAGVLLFGLLKMIVGVGAVVAIAVTAYGLDLHTLTVGIVPVVVMLLICGYAIAFGVIGLMLRYGSGAEAFAWGILFVVMPLSGVFYPITALPSVIQPISRALPTTYLFSLGRTLTETGRLPGSTLIAAAVSTVGVTALTFAYCAWMMSLFRRRGYITRWS